MPPWYTITDFFEKRTASIFRAEELTKKQEGNLHMTEKFLTDNMLMQVKQFQIMNCIINQFASDTVSCLRNCDLCFVRKPLRKRNCLTLNRRNFIRSYWTHENSSYFALFLYFNLDCVYTDVIAVIYYQLHIFTVSCSFWRVKLQIIFQL
jgi:hypothetical protein